MIMIGSVDLSSESQTITDRNENSDSSGDSSIDIMNDSGSRMSY